MCEKFPKVFDKTIDSNGKVKYLIMKWIDETKLSTKEYKAVKIYNETDQISLSQSENSYESIRKQKVSRNKESSSVSMDSQQSVKSSLSCEQINSSNNNKIKKKQEKQILIQNSSNSSSSLSNQNVSPDQNKNRKQIEQQGNESELIWIKSESRSRSGEVIQKDDSLEKRLIDNNSSNSPIQRVNDIEELNQEPKQQLTLNDIIINNIIRCNFFKDLNQWKVLVAYVLNDYSKPDTIWINAESVYLKEKVMLFQFLKRTKQLKIIEDIQSKLEDKQSYLAQQLNLE